MIITNSQGLSESQKQKVKKPYASNSGKPIDFKAAARKADAFFEANPDLLKDTAELLNESN
ncbi:hypothetical protein GBZ26_14330 [Azospirillum formosense]|uniref:Uncharacterized protein n=1 Tax=Azospirillum formosense TaxID=861533 RepID=A0ABX2KUN5_9PROT|nr:hypothetical protein [Azospirillum formosense]MBY3753994.1 hypothetical protein [Azospirillum formosense]NUB20379.1 hypothetical protein [Azospirillum formosense]